MRLQRQSNGQFITLDSESVLGVGGEARIYAIPQDPWLVAKVYHRPTTERARKLVVMLANPPDDPMVAQGRVSIAWPLDLLRSADSKSQIVGFLMPLVTGMRPILDFYNPGARRKRCPLFNYLYLHRAARNLSAAVSALHERGYVIGDMNESNIFVAETALVALVDTDSFQVRDPHNRNVYRCTVGKIEFTPPELQGGSFADIDRKPAHDLFGLAVLIFQLLMEGTHPFTGIFKGEGDPPSYGERISAGHFPYSGKRRVPYRPSLIAPSFGILNPELRKLFVRCFRNGRRRPKVRPDARTWQRALNDAEKALVTCPQNDQHLYGDHLKSCPWCERSRRLGDRDPFPSQESVESGQHLQPASRTRTMVSPKKTAGSSQILTNATPIRQSTVLNHNVWPCTSLMLALLALFMLGDDLLPLPWWLSLVCGAAIAAWCAVGWHRVRKLARRSRWMTMAGLGTGAALILALLLVTVVPGAGLPWWLLLACQAALGSAAFASGAAGWRKTRSLPGYSRWLAGAALGMGIAASILAISFVVMLTHTGRLPVWLPLILAPTLGPIALICGAAGWQQVKTMAGQGKWARSMAMGTGTGMMLLSLLTLLEAFLLVSGRLYLTTLVCEAVFAPAALIYGALDWQRVKKLKVHCKWLHGVILGAGTTALMLGLLLIAVLSGESLPWWLSPVCAAALVPAVVVCPVIGWRRVKLLAGRARWASAAASGLGLPAALMPLIAATLVKEKLPWWLSLMCALILSLTAFISGVLGWRWVRILAGRGRWVASAALGLVTAAILASLLVLLETFMLSSGRLYLTGLVCGAALGLIALQVTP